MAFLSRSGKQGAEVMGEINMTPLVDVMLVLLVVFIITVPVIKHAVQVQLPQVSSAPAPVKPQTIALSVDAEGRYFWDQVLVDEGELAQRLAAASQQEPASEIHLRGDQRVPYVHVARLIGAVQQAGLGKIGFVSDPAPSTP